MLAGNHGFKRRKIHAPELEALQADPQKPAWHQTFGRWSATVRLCRKDLERPRSPNAADALLIAVQQPDSSISWCLFDEPQNLVAPVKVDPRDLPAPTYYNLTNQFMALRNEAPGAPIAIRAIAEISVPVEVTGEWREVYHFLALQNVMVDWSDIEPWS